MTLAALAAAVHEADSRFAVHDRACQAWKYGLDCLKHKQLENDALDAAERYQAAAPRAAGRRS